MAIVTGVRELTNNTKKMIKDIGPDYDIELGYKAKHALWVHEAREMKLRGQPRKSGIGVYWGPKGRAGFLLDVARESTREVRAFIAERMKKGGYWTWKRALWQAVAMLLRKSQDNIPIEHGDLRDSAFQRVKV